jgi:hypothetical protein
LLATSGVESLAGISRKRRFQPEHGDTMRNHLAAVILEDSSVLIDERNYWKVGDIADALVSALRNDPLLIVIVKPTNYQHFEGVIRLIYATRLANVADENVLYTTEDGNVIRFDTLGSKKSPTFRLNINPVSHGFRPQFSQSRMPPRFRTPWCQIATTCKNPCAKSFLKAQRRAYSLSISL